MTAPSLLTEELATIVLCFSPEFAHFLMDAHLLTGAQHCHFRPVKCYTPKINYRHSRGLPDSVQTITAALGGISRPQQRDIHDKLLNSIGIDTISPPIRLKGLADKCN
jgi:hypothetical protein